MHNYGRQNITIVVIYVKRRNHMKNIEENSYKDQPEQNNQNIQELPADILEEMNSCNCGCCV